MRDRPDPGTIELVRRSGIRPVGGVVGVQAELEQWVREQLQVVKITAHRSRPWADLWRVETRDGLWWLKLNKHGTRHEPRVLSLLGGLTHPIIPTARTHPTEPWSLIADAGREARAQLRGADDVDVIAFWSDLLTDYGEVQRSLEAADLLAAGVPDFRPDRSVQRFDELLADTDWFNSPAVSVSAADRARIENLRPRIGQVADELSVGVGPALQHDDLHDNNVLVVGGDLTSRRVIDWGDSVVAHPFATLRITLGSLRDDLAPAEASAGLDRVSTAYLEGWCRDGVSLADLRRQLELTDWLECLSRAACWVRALGSVEDAVQAGYAEAPYRWLERMVDAPPPS